MMMKNETQTETLTELSAMHSAVTAPSEFASPQTLLEYFLEKKLAEIGYELVAIEIFNHREKRLRVFIDTPQGCGIAVGIEDCVKTSHHLDEPLEKSSEIEAIFKGPYELEVSSPGIERPLRKASDYVRFAGEVGRIHTFRALNSQETGAVEYTTKNPKQKNFFGFIRGFEGRSLETGSVLMGVVSEDGIHPKAKLVKGKPTKPKPETLIRIPASLISKANLEPEIDLTE